MADEGIHDSPFQVVYKTAKPGETQLPAKWSVPFDTEFREVEIPNAVEPAMAAYAALGHHVVRNAYAYCPAYSVVSSVNTRLTNSQAMLKSLQANAPDGFSIVDRRNSTVYWLHCMSSQYEAAISWFVREHGHENSVLCRDAKDGAWYVEAMLPELTLTLDAEGHEVAPDEAVAHVAYNTALHTSAVMAYGA